MKKSATETVPTAKPDAIALRGDCFARACPARTILTHLGSRWGSLIVSALRCYDVLRFSQLRAQIDGISEKVLSQKLRELERDGLVTRTMYPVVPPRVEYRLSPLGVGAAHHAQALVSWIEENVDGITRAQDNYDASARGRDPASPAPAAD